ncbi:GH3 auxin-responsive promoter family protein [Trichocoleus desertorum AS-A10]|uniref:GH3 family domain-containing protein n=1 Tax=Trichocoleus desertorum TaxID=1481672 RepID=UPI00329A1142
MRPIIQLFAKLLSPEAHRFHQALQDPQAAQQKVQKKIFECFVASEYGRSLGVRSLTDWQKIPIVNYADLEPWIERQRQIQQALLTPQPILFYEKTSGSRGAAKWIPYTRSLRRSFSQMFCIWAHDLITNGPQFSTGKVYFCISPQLTQPTQTEAGVQVGLENDAEYLDGWLQWALRPFLLAPTGLSRLCDPEAFKEQLCLGLLQSEKLEIISIWSPSFLSVHLDYIQQHRQKLCEQLRDRVSPKRFALLSDPTTSWTEIWPHLKLISCWNSVNAADQAQALRSHFPGVMVQGKGLLATEAPMTVPLIAAQGSVPLLNEVFFEFEDSTGKIHLLHELEPATEYSIILSQKGGLYRYRMGDRVWMTHTYLNTPCLEFLGRDQMTSDLVGEKLHAAFVAQVLDHLNLGGTTFRTLVPVTQPQPHYILLLNQADREGDAIAQRLDAALSESPHYEHARLLGQLAPAQVWVSPDVPDLVLRQKLQAGQKWGDIKHEVLATKPIETLPTVGLRSSSSGRVG